MGLALKGLTSMGQRINIVLPAKIRRKEMYGSLKSENIYRSINSEAKTMIGLISFSKRSNCI